MYVTNDIFFASAMVMAHSGPFEPDYVTIRIDLNDRGFSDFTLDIPEEDAKIFWAEYMSGQLAISDLVNFKKRYNDLVQASKSLQRSGERSWIAQEPPMTPERMNAAAAQGERVTALREAFERKKNVAA